MQQLKKMAYNIFIDLVVCARIVSESDVIHMLPMLTPMNAADSACTCLLVYLFSIFSVYFVSPSLRDSFRTSFLSR